VTFSFIHFEPDAQRSITNLKHPGPAGGPEGMDGVKNELNYRKSPVSVPWYRVIPTLRMAVSPFPTPLHQVAAPPEQAWSNFFDIHARLI
jgi:hypothetical protein